MATPKKKHLIGLMIEAGVKWPEWAEYAAQDKDCNGLYFYLSKPSITIGCESWRCKGIIGGVGKELPELCRKWNKTIVTREQYAESLDDSEADEQSFIESTPSSACALNNTPSIEQLTADYHAKAAEADSLQSVADEALKAADDALLALEKAGELLGLNISIISTQKQPAQPEITDWRDLRVGDVVVVDYVDSIDKVKIALEGKEAIIVRDGNEYPICVTNSDYPGGESWWLGGPAKCKWRFIRRP